MLKNPVQKLQDKVDDYEETLQQVADLTEEALDPALSREKVIAKVKQISELVLAEEEEEEPGE